MTSRCLLLLSACVAYTPWARAADPGGFDAHGFNLATLTSDPRAPLVVERPARFEMGDLSIGGVFEYASLPLAQYTRTDGVLSDRTPVLDDIFALNMSAAIAVWDRARVGVAVPIYFTSTGSGSVPQGAGLGDIRLTGMVEIIRPDDGDAGGLGLGVIPYIDLPSGDEASVLGQGGATGGGKLAASWEGTAWTLGGDAGVQFEPAIDLENLQGSDKLQLGGHLGYLLDPSLGVNLEAHVEVPFQANDAAGTDLPGEALLSVRRRTDGGGHVLVGGAVALSRGASAANYRVFLGGGFGSVPRVVDTDLDGLIDTKDKCPTDPETVNTYRDEDGCPDERPMLALRITRDGAGVAGALVSLSDGTAPVQALSGLDPWMVGTQPGTAWTARASLGACLAGEAAVTATEGRTDLIVSLQPVRNAQATVEVVDPAGNPVPGAVVSWSAAEAACAPAGAPLIGVKTPTGTGKHTATASAIGFRPGSASVELQAGDDVTVRIVLTPVAVKVTQQQIVLLAPVYFDYNQATIRADSFVVVDDVLAVLREHPELHKVEIGGHTDSDGSSAYNQDLSQRRVDAVRAYLIERGIDADRLVARGYGESRPVATNRTDDGKAKNRRVEFVIVGRAEPAGTPRAR